MPALPPRAVARLRHMREAAEKAIAFTVGRDRSILDSDEMRTLALVRLLEIIGEAARAVSEPTRLGILAIRMGDHRRGVRILSAPREIDALALAGVFRSLSVTAAGRWSTRALNSARNPLQPSPQLARHSRWRRQFWRRCRRCSDGGANRDPPDGPLTPRQHEVRR